MQTGYYSATGGMVTQFNRLDMISNNLANLNTNGYKKDNVVIGDYLRVFQESRDELPLDNHTREGAKFLNRSIVRVPKVVEEYTDFGLGGFKATNNPFDISLKEDDKFFAVETPNGVRYTRDGAFTLNSNGELVTREGFLVLPTDYEMTKTAITIPENSRITVDEDGKIYADEIEIASLQVAQFKDIKYLKKEGNNLFRAELPADKRELSDSRAVIQGFVEKSNVNAVTEMTSLIEANRLVGMYQKAMDTQMNDLNSDAINKLANIKA